jgi:hypothetical protein
LSDKAFAAIPRNHPELAGHLAHAASLAGNLYARTRDRTAAERAQATSVRALDLMASVPVIKSVVVANTGSMLVEVRSCRHPSSAGPR